MKPLGFKKYLKTCALVLICTVFLVLPASSENTTVLEGKVTYTVESARNLAFEGVPRKIPAEEFVKFMQDTDRKENLKALKGKFTPKNRSVQAFRGLIIKAYAVNYYDNPKYTYYYVNGLNQLVFTDIDEVTVRDKEKINYPFRTFRYDIRGRLIAVGIYVSDEERFLYKENGKLISHWVGNLGYNARGRKIGTIEEIEF